MGSYQRVDLSGADGLAGWEEEQWPRMSPASTPSSLSSDCLSTLDSRSPSPCPKQKQRPAWKLPWPFTRKSKQTDKKDHPDRDFQTFQDLVFQQRAHRRPPPLHIPVLPTDSTPTASPLSPSWWTAATTPSTEAASPLKSSLSLAESPGCICHHRVVEKEGCRCGNNGGEAAAAAITTTITTTPGSARHTTRSSVTSLLFKGKVADTRRPRTPVDKYDDKMDESTSSMFGVDTGIGRRRSAGEISQKRSQRHNPTHAEHELSTSSSPSGPSKHRQFLQQKLLYNQYLLGHPDWFDLHLATPMLSQADKHDYEKKGIEVKPKSAGWDKRAAAAAAQGGQRGRGGRGSRGFQRRKKWRTMQRWLAVLGLAAVLTIGAMLVLRLARNHSQPSPSSFATASSDMKPGTTDPTLEGVRQPSGPSTMLEKAVGGLPTAPPPPLARQEEIYAQDPQQEEIDRLLFSGGGDRWVDDRSGATWNQGGSQMHASRVDASLSPQDAFASSQKLASEQEQAHKPSDTGPLLEYDPDDDDDD